tara:strand:+ start:2827 stop:3459 length:633 start_codon:yes stop_codon:yes gene_type:complete
MIEMLGLGGNTTPMNNGALNLGQPNVNQNPWATQNNAAMFNATQSPFAQGMFGGQQAGQFAQQPVAPPSELEIQMMLLKGITPIERFVASPQMGVLIEMLNNLVSYSVLEILRNASFVTGDDGSLKMDVTALPQELQTMSAENVTGQFSTLQANAQQKINQAEMEQQQLAAYAQQSMMGGALSAALANEGMMEKVGGGLGSIGRSFIGLK